MLHTHTYLGSSTLEPFRPLLQLCSFAKSREVLRGTFQLDELAVFVFAKAREVLRATIQLDELAVLCNPPRLKGFPNFPLSLTLYSLDSPLRPDIQLTSWIPFTSISVKFSFMCIAASFSFKTL